MDGGNTFRQARFLGTAVLRNGASPTIQVVDTFETGESVEWYRFRIRGRASSVIKPILTFSGNEFANRMQVFQAVNGQPRKSMARLDTINSQRQRPLPEGTYFIKLLGTPAPAESGQFATFAARIDLFS